MIKKDILITGFEPFNEFKSNPSGLLAAAMEEQFTNKINSTVLPVDYFSARQNLLALLQKHKPTVCICMGLAKGDTFRIETKARIPKEYSSIDGRNEYLSLIPENIKTYCDRECNFILSADCGQYVCEATLWTLLDFADKNAIPSTAFFLHVPAISQNWPYSKIQRVGMDFLEFITNELSQ